MGEILIKNLAPKVGDRVLYRDKPATVIAHDPNDQTYPYMLGWRPGDEMPASVRGNNTLHGGSMDPRRLGAQVIANIEQYTTTMWVVSHAPVQPLAAAPDVVKSGGIRCAGRYCQTFNEYAVGNQPDGSFLCYQCRSRPSFMRR